MRRGLQREIRRFLEERGASTEYEIRVGLRARRADVAAALAEGPFRVVGRPDGGSVRATYWNASERVPAAPSGRAARLLEILSDGLAHSRASIIEAADGSFLTNNAAAELRPWLRSTGRDVVFSGGGYRIVSLAAPEGPPGPVALPSGAASETPTTVRVAV